MPLVVVERRHAEPATDQELDAMHRAAETCFELNEVTLVQAIGSNDRKRFICLFEAKDVESVRRALESAQVPYETAWAGGSLFQE